MAALYRERAKRWETNPYLAEWLSRSIAYCRTEVGAKEFREWLRFKWPEEKEYQHRLRRCLAPPKKLWRVLLEPRSEGGHMRRWALAAVDLGVSDEGLELFHTFCANYNIEMPERSAPPIKRRRGESVEMWNARLHEALITGSKMVDVDWEEMRRIAISEYDNTRDTLEVWRTDPGSFLRGWLERADSTVLGGPELERADGVPYEILATKLVAAWRSRLHLMTVGHAHWYRAVNVFEELARRGLTTTTAVERAYQADPALKWRLLSVFCTTLSYSSKHGSMVNQTMLSQKEFRPYVHMWRDDNGLLRIDAHKKNIPPAGSIAGKITKAFNGSSSISTALEMMESHFQTRPDDAKLFSSAAWNALGDSAILDKFMFAFTKSDFGLRLAKTADAVTDLRGDDLKLFEKEFLFVTRNVLKAFPYAPTPAFNKSEGMKLCDFLTETILGEMWLQFVFNQLLNARKLADGVLGALKAHKPGWDLDRFSDVAEFLPALAADRSIVRLVDATWLEYDRALWFCAVNADEPGDGRVTTTFGLFDPRDLRRPVCSSADDIFGRTVPHVAATPAPAAPEEYVQTLPVAAPAEAAQSGHAAARDAAAHAPKEKTKTRGDAASDPVDSGDSTAGGKVDSTVGGKVEIVDDYPDVLPSTFKLAKKNHNVFRQILGYKEPTAAGEAPVKPGVVRWEQFERAMRRIGFETVQTAGSSVRFDPPARTARPITFHRPHPEAVLSPYLLKWIGARLKRSYGWTAQTFEYDPSLSDPAS
ncbi:hypothetical protein AURDEDRAFT_114653 [Auricularia subglabra TFB-10046 SS5]|nr:hypothetical protein AURDEDRAFT_114653 [Auricularia subglabra TFB-10046 SS5]